MGQHLVTHDPCDPSDFRDPFDPWPMTHRPIPCSALRLPTEGWPDWVDLGGWLYTVYWDRLPAPGVEPRTGHPFQYYPDQAESNFVDRGQRATTTPNRQTVGTGFHHIGLLPMTQTNIYIYTFIVSSSKSRDHYSFCETQARFGCRDIK